MIILLSGKLYLIHFFKINILSKTLLEDSLTQLAHNVVTTLIFGCLLVATLDNVKAALSQRSLSDVVALTKI